MWQHVFSPFAIDSKISRIIKKSASGSHADPNPWTPLGGQEAHRNVLNFGTVTPFIRMWCMALRWGGIIADTYIITSYISKSCLRIVLRGEENIFSFNLTTCHNSKSRRAAWFAWNILPCLASKILCKNTSNEIVQQRNTGWRAKHLLGTNILKTKGNTVGGVHSVKRIKTF